MGEPSVYYPSMARSFLYLIDGLNPERGERLKKALEQVAEITGVIVRPAHGVVEVHALRDPEHHVRMACAIVGTSFRVKMKRRNLF